MTSGRVPPPQTFRAAALERARADIRNLDRWGVTSDCAFAGAAVLAIFWQVFWLAALLFLFGITIRIVMMLKTRVAEKTWIIAEVDELWGDEAGGVVDTKRISVPSLNAPPEELIAYLEEQLEQSKARHGS